MLQAAIEITPSQHERYLDLADAYTSFVQQARQHRTTALDLIGRVRQFGKTSGCDFETSVARLV